MTIENMTVNELLTRLQTYYNAGTYSDEDISIWLDEFENRNTLFLGCLYVAIRREHSKTFKTLPDVAIATKCLPATSDIYAKVEKAIEAPRIEERETISDEERKEMAEALSGLLKKLQSGAGRCKTFHSVKDVS